MRPVTITPDLLHHLVAGSHAEGTTCLAVAAVIDNDDGRVLLLAEPDDNFADTFDLPAGLVLPGETLLDALARTVTLTTGLAVYEVASYLGHHDHPGEETTRTFCFAVTVTDPDRVCRAGRIPHRWVHEGDLPTPAIDYLHNPPPQATTRCSAEPSHAGPLRAWAHGVYPDQAAVELLIDHNVFLQRSDFTDAFVHTHNDPSSRGPIATLDWAAAATALDTGNLPCSASEARTLRIAASLAGGPPVDLRDATTSVDAHTAELLSQAILHATGHPTATALPQ